MPTRPSQKPCHQAETHSEVGIIRTSTFADDFVIMVAGAKSHAEALWDEVAEVIAPLGLKISVAKSRVCHLDEGFNFLGFHIQQRLKKGGA
ncbi:reverse transcriptase domain-containing protein (plasmid) [Pseudarthrobacter sp. P1]|uniref:reverse transcriptase domain-containing protein n=1 Tax=Pseudarthrobacter sp. P1 TaxID=3418418 RepID=UPI003CFA091E